MTHSLRSGCCVRLQHITVGQNLNKDLQGGHSTKTPVFFLISVKYVTNWIPLIARAAQLLRFKDPGCDVVDDLDQDVQCRSPLKARFSSAAISQFATWSSIFNRAQPIDDDVDLPRCKDIAR
jgi:hypothetical protein